MPRAAGPAVVALLAFVLALPASAAQREVIIIPVDDVVTDPNLCDFPVTFEYAGTARVTLTRNAEGLITREADHGKLAQTISSPYGSFSFPNQNPSLWDYGDGAEVGSPVVATFHGLGGHVPGHVSSDAGYVQVSGTVTGFDDLGIPLVEFSGAVVAHGHFNDGDTVQAGICAALAP
jgi:hypothetical protein